jgi:hypothetical protein
VDLPTFALGISPRDPEVRSALLPVVDAARRSVFKVRPKSVVEEMIDRVPRSIDRHMSRAPVGRLVFALAGVQLRWDARVTRLLPSPAPEMDEEDARRELARRFLRSLGPADPTSFTRWAAVSESDARATFDALAGELVEIECPGGKGWLLADDGERLVAAEPVAGIRFLPFGGDPVLQRGNEIELGHAARRAALPPWASTGLVLADGDVVASWGRRQGRITLFAPASLGDARRGEIEEEAATAPFGSGKSSVWR